VQPGEFVLARGDPLGLRSSVTDGIVSSTGRTVGEGNGVVISSAIQTSAPINPGNPGGALVDLTGEVIGIPTLAATDPELEGGRPTRSTDEPASVLARLRPGQSAAVRVLHPDGSRATATVRLGEAHD
jgi:S1-C subfamily serine protease